MKRGIRAGCGAVLIACVSAVEGLAQPTDTVSVMLVDGGAEITQRLVPDGDSVGAYAMRFEGQELHVLEVVREGESLLDATLTPQTGAYELDVVSGAPIRVRYSIAGAADRIPLFVVGGSAELTVARGVEEPYLIRLEGPNERLAEIDLETSLPRFETSDSGALEARLSSVPSLVRLSSRGAFTFTRIADLVALGLILIGIVWAIQKLRGASRVAASPGP